MIRRLPIALLAIALLMGCDTKSLVNIKNSGHPDRLQQVSTVDKAAAFYAHLTYFRKSGRGSFVEQSGGQILELRDEATFWATYFAPNQRFYTVANKSDTIKTGGWRIEDNERGGAYPRLCYEFDDTADRNRETCVWPYDFFSEAPEQRQVLRGDIFNLASGRVPDVLLNAETSTSLSSILATQVVAPVNLATLNATDLE